jgi:hypothetical protein
LKIPECLKRAESHWKRGVPLIGYKLLCKLGITAQGVPFGVRSLQTKPANSRLDFSVLGSTPYLLRSNYGAPIREII